MHHHIPGRTPQDLLGSEWAPLSSYCGRGRSMWKGVRSLRQLKGLTGVSSSPQLGSRTPEYRGF